MRFEWNEEKARSNHRKHGVTFEEATTVFDDPLAVIFDDEQHSVGERREILIGYSGEDRLLLVFFTERPPVVRILSARSATRQEHRNYEESLHIRSL